MRVLSWLFNKLKERELQRNSKYITKLFTSEKYKALQELIGVNIKNKSYFIQALMHRSFLEQHSEFEVSNERLEFLGDSVLSLVVAEHLFEVFPAKDEGFLTKVRAKLVNRLALADAAEKIDLAAYLLVSKNLSNTFTNGSKTVIADAFEALIGAIYLDSGLDAARNFIHKTLIIPSAKEGVYLIDENYKSQLLEYAQGNKMENPVYTVVNEDGPQHNRIFTITVSMSGIEYGTGVGRNKKSAEQIAAKAALEKILAQTAN